MKLLLPLMMIPPLLVVDQVTKHLVSTRVPPSSPIKVMPFLQIVNVKNTGAAFGILQGLGNSTFVIITTVAIIIVFFIYFKSREDSLSLTLILAGAMGNLIDRLRYGYVVDFIDIHIGRYHWPAFNVSDSLLTIGVFLLFFKLFKKG